MLEWSIIDAYVPFVCFQTQENVRVYVHKSANISLVHLSHVAQRIDLEEQTAGFVSITFRKSIDLLSVNRSVNS